MRLPRENARERCTGKVRTIVFAKVIAVADVQAEKERRIAAYAGNVARGEKIQFIPKGS